MQSQDMDYSKTVHVYTSIAFTPLLMNCLENKHRLFIKSIVRAMMKPTCTLHGHADKYKTDLYTMACVLLKNNTSLNTTIKFHASHFTYH